MIRDEDLDEMRLLLEVGDRAKARLIYQKSTGMKISPRSIEKFVRGERLFLHGKHRAANILQALALAVKDRIERRAADQKLVKSVMDSTRQAASAAACQ